MKFRLALLVFATVLAAATFPTAASADGGASAVGAPLPLTGEFAEFGIMMKNSMELALEYVNQTGGIDGRRLRIVYADDEGKESSAAGAFERLSSAGVAMLVGGYASNATYRLAQIADDGDMPFLICTASADKITRRGWRNVFRLNPPISEYTAGLEDFWIKNAKPDSMAIVFENSMFGTDAALHMMEFCRENAIDVDIPAGYDRDRRGALYFRSLLAPLVSDPPDVAYLVSYLEDAVALVKTARELEIPSLLCGGGGGYTSDEFLKRAGEDAEGMLTAALWSEHATYPGADGYFFRYKDRFGKAPDYHGAEAYSAVLVAADALARSESAEPSDIRAALEATYLKTPFGPVKFYDYEGYERQNSVDTMVLQVIDGKFETVWPPRAASRQYAPPFD